MSSIQQQKFPIGKFQYGQTYSNKQIRGFIKDIQKLPKRLVKALGKLDESDIDMPYRTGGWTGRQVVHHLADSHMNAYIRTKLAVTEENPTVKPYMESRWAELSDAKSASISLSLDILKAVHKRWSIFLNSLDDAALSRTFFHPGLGRNMTMGECLALYSWHGQHHVAHIKLLSGWEPKITDEEISAQIAATASSKTAKAEPNAAPKRRGPVPGRKKALAEAVAAPAPKAAKAAKTDKDGKQKRLRRSKEQIAADNARLAAEKAARGPVDKIALMAKARAAAAANRAARGIEPKAAAAPKRIRRSKEQIAADNARLAAEKAARKAAPKAKKAATPTRIRRTKEQIAADNARLAAEKAARGPVDRAAQMAKARAARGIAPKAKKEKAPPTRIRRSKEQIEADNARLAAEKAARKAAPKEKKARKAPDREAVLANLARARATAAANRAAKGIVPKAKPEKKTPLTREEVLALMAKARATAAANRAAKGIVPKEKVKKEYSGPLDKETMLANLAKARATAAANRAAKLAAGEKITRKPSKKG